MFDTLNKNTFLTKTILDSYSDTTGLPIGYKNKSHKVKFLWQTNKTCCSPLCQLLLDIRPSLCHNDHSRRANQKLNYNVLQFCHAGLANMIIPINYNGIIIGLMITGQRKYIGEEEKSLNLLKKLKEDNIDPQYHSRIDDCYSETKSLDKGDFENNINIIRKIVTDKLLYAALLTDNERIDLINLTHTLRLPTQSIIASTEYIETRMNKTNSDIVTLSNKLKSLCTNNDRTQISINVEQIREVQNIFDEIKNRNDQILIRTRSIHGQVITQAHLAENMKSSLSKEDKRIRFELKNILSIIQDSKKLFISEAEKKGIKFIVDIPYYIYLQVSVEHISRAFFNLIHNSIKYSYKSDPNFGFRKIKIIGESDDKYYKITITNYGVGILPEEIEKVFESGVRGKFSTDRNRNGSGLGLTEAKSIIEAHKGTISISSTPVREGINSPYITEVVVKLLKNIPIINYNGDMKDGIHDGIHNDL